MCVCTARAGLLAASIHTPADMPASSRDACLWFSCPANFKASGGSYVSGERRREEE